MQNYQVKNFTEFWKITSTKSSVFCAVAKKKNVAKHMTYTYFVKISIGMIVDFARTSDRKPKHGYLRTEEVNNT